MKGVVRRRVSARQDLIAAFQRYAREAGSGVARLFRPRPRPLSAPGIHAGMGTRYEADDPAFGELRYFALSAGFQNYPVFYRPVTDGIEVARVLHGARDIQAILMEELGE